MVTEAISAPFYAPLSDRFGRRPVVLVLLVLWAVGGAGFGLCESVWSAVAMRAYRAC
jgi:MFS family permease